MSDVQSRPSAPRGRGSYRGRGGYSSRGGRGASRAQKSEEQENVPPPSIEEQGETGLLKKKYGSKVSSLKEIFPDWTDDDLVFALDETNGDIEDAINGITEGNISQWGEVKKKHTDRARSKVKDTGSTTAEGNGSAARGGRGRGAYEGRGRGRGDRGRGGRGGRAAAHTNGTRSADKPAKETTSDGWDTAPAPVAEPGAWDNATSSKPTGEWDETTNGETAAAGDWATAEPTEPVNEIPKEQPKSSVIPAGSKGGWASLFAKPAPTPTPKKAAVPPGEETVGEPVPEESQAVETALPDPEETTPAQDAVTQLPEIPPSDPAITLTPSKDELTESNVEQLPDVSINHATDTAASTVASTQDPHSTLTSAVPAIRPGMSGYATSAFKATAGSGRSASFQRRVMEQQEAVVMPGNHAVDRAAVQFGSMGLNDSTEDLDVDEDREEAETRTQPPNDSPIAPRASLPPPTQQSQPSSEHLPVARPAPGLPPAPQQAQSQPQPPSPPQPSVYGSFGRYGEAPQKPFDPFGQQQSQAQLQAHDQYASSMPAQAQQPTSTAGNDYSSFYTTNQQRDYQNYYGNYGQSQESGQQRTGSAFGTSAQDISSQYATSQPQARYGQPESQGSGHNTPNPTLPGQQAQQPSQHMPQGQGAYGAYPYGYPNNYQYHPQYANYMNQMNQQQPHSYGRNRPMFDDARRYEDSHGSQGNQYANYGSHYSAAPYGKGGMYNQPQQPYSYEHSASPANVGGFNQSSLGRESSYGRTGSAQPTESQQTGGGNAYGGMPDVFARSQSGFGQGQNLSQQHSGQQAGGDDPAKGSYEAPKVSGPSPSLQTNRPGSAANNIGAQPHTGQSGFPPPSQQSGQQGFGGYGQYAGLGGLGGHHQGAGAGQNQHQGSQYGNYAGFGGNYGYGQQSGGRGGGWGGNYGH